MEFLPKLDRPRNAVLLTLLSLPVIVGVDLFQYALKAWLIGGALRQALWNAFIDVFDEDETKILFFAGAFSLIVWYWVIGGLYTVLDVTLKPEALRKYKIQPGQNEPVDSKRLRNVIETVLINQFVVGLPAIYLSTRLTSWRDPPPLRQLPAFHWVLVQLFFCLLEQEFSYYYIHRLFHHRYFYKYVHKKHHEWTAPIAISAIYCTAAEQFFANLLPVYMGLFIVNAHASTYFLWYLLAVFFTLSEHSGYHLPFMTSPEVHDFHHYSFVNNFGFLGILDGLHGTDKLFKKSMSFPRHFVLTDTRSARERVPERP